MPAARTAAMPASLSARVVKSPLAFMAAAASMKSLGLFRPRKFL
jgi:hypothetical protein